MPWYRWSRQARGEATEERALHFLLQKGLKLLRRNYRSRRGEIDLVMEQGDTVVFVEVRYRAGEGFGGAAASVDGRKQRRLTAAAAHFLQAHPAHGERPCRFDVVAAEGESLHWIPDAFRPEP